MLQTGLLEQLLVVFSARLLRLTTLHGVWSVVHFRTTSIPPTAVYPGTMTFLC